YSGTSRDVSYTLSLHDALPISATVIGPAGGTGGPAAGPGGSRRRPTTGFVPDGVRRRVRVRRSPVVSSLTTSSSGALSEVACAGLQAQPPPPKKCRASPPPDPPVAPQTACPEVGSSSDA